MAKETIVPAEAERAQWIIDGYNQSRAYCDPRDGSKKLGAVNRQRAQRLRRMWEAFDDSAEGIAAYEKMVLKLRKHFKKENDGEEWPAHGELAAEQAE